MLQNEPTLQIHTGRVVSKSHADALYGDALPSTRSGSLYNAFPYPTKISPEAIALFILAHTQPGDTIFDGFAGSGTTGLATLLCNDPPVQLRQDAARLGIDASWGSRNAILYELGTLGAFVSRVLNNPPEPREFYKAASQLLSDTMREFGWLYSTRDPSGQQSVLRYIVWSDVLLCFNCGSFIDLWDVCVSLNPAHIASKFHCPRCQETHSIGNVERSTKRNFDDLLQKVTESRERKIARVYGISGSKTWSREPNEQDCLLLARVSEEDIPSCVPIMSIPWGDLYRRGYHHGITHVHHFYTRRNLIAFGRLWERANDFSSEILDALRFWLLSYNSSHATLMSRVIAKSKQNDLVVTGAQPGVLYVSGLPVEKNVFHGLARKLSGITSAFRSIYGNRTSVSVEQRSSCSVDLPDSSVDYIFTDPPFGANIPYSEITFLNEAWLGRVTDASDEAIVSRTQEKTVDDYRQILTRSFTELNRILKPHGNATMVFHSSSASIWNAFQNAYTHAGFSVENTGVLDKKQGSFKQVTTNGSVRGDPVLLLRKYSSTSNRSDLSAPWHVAEKLRIEATKLDLAEQTPERLYSRLVNYFLSQHQEVPIDADEYYRWLVARQAETNRTIERSSS